MAKPAEPRPRKPKRFSDRQLRDAMTRLRVPVVALDLKGRLLEANPTFFRLLESSADHAVKANFFERFAASPDRERAESYFRESVRIGLPSLPGQMVLVSTAGTLVHVSWSSSPIESADGNVAGILCVGCDTTGQMRDEARQSHLVAAIEKVAQEWSQTFDAIQMPIVLLREDAIVARLNRAAADLAGLGNIREALGLRVDAIAQGQPWRQAAELASTVSVNRSPSSCQVRDGSNGRVWDVAATILPRSGSSDTIILVARDITRMVDLQELLRRSETMSALGRLVVAVAHEIRNPLFIISATLDTLESEVLRLNDDFHEYAGVLRRQKDRLAKLLDELLTYGKPMALDLSPQTLRQTVEQAVEACAPLASECGVRIDASVPSNLPSILGDGIRLVQIFQNVIENAIFHAPAGSRVRVEGELVVLDERLWIECRVSDSGPGIRSKDISRIFEPFFTRRKNGTGLGLSLVQRIVEQHGGEIFARNRVEGGALMTIRLPAETRI